ncbi:MAG: transglutaminase-like domain-containing protein [Desulfobacteraceae bacterium]
MSRSRAAWHIMGSLLVLVWLVALAALVRGTHPPGPVEGTTDINAPSSLKTPERQWKEIYLGDRKVGYSVSHIRPAGDGYLLHVETFLKMTLMGLATGLHTHIQCTTDQDFGLSSFRFRMHSGAVRFEASGRVKDGHIQVEAGSGGGLEAHRVPIETPPVIGAGMGHYFRDAELEVGRTFSFPVFDPSTMTCATASIRVADRDKITIKGIPYDSFRLETELWGGRFSFWLDREGRVLKEEGFMGLTAVRSSAAAAPEGIQGSGELDFYEISAVVPDRTIPDPERVGHLEVRLEGIEEPEGDPASWKGFRQELNWPLLKVTREGLPSDPASKQDLEMEVMASYLDAEFNIESDHPEVRRRAESIAGGLRDPVEAAGAVMEWVYENVDKRPVVALPSALEVLRTKAGDCNEHAVLTTALLRALGIPSRIVVGLVYTRGKFFYHAWTEAFLGEWISIDSTFKQMPVDATHIRILEGNLDKQVELAGLIGRLRLKIVDYAYDSSG